MSDRVAGRPSFFIPGTLVCSLIGMPHVIFWDEPFAGIDDEKISYVEACLEHLDSSIHAIVISDHYPRSLPLDFRFVELNANE